MLLSAAFVFHKTWRSLRGYLLNRPIALGWRWHWQPLKAALLKTGWKAVLAIPMFFWLVHSLQVAFEDQQDLFKQNRTLHDANKNTESACEQHIKDAVDHFTGSIAGLNQTIASLKSARDILDQQVRYQRNTIDSFGAQIIKVTAKPRKITPLLLDQDASNAARKHMKVLVLTNQDITPIMMTVVCDSEVVSRSTIIVGAGFMSGGTSKVARNAIQIKYDAPAWTDVFPLVVSIDYQGENAPTCSFNPR